MAFEYTPYRNPYIGTIADLMARGEDAKAKALIDIASAQARAAEAKGQIYGNAISSIGNQIGNIPAQMQANREQAFKADQQARMVRGQQQEDAAEATFNQIMSQKNVLGGTFGKMSAPVVTPGVMGTDMEPDIPETQTLPSRAYIPTVTNPFKELSVKGVDGLDKWDIEKASQQFASLGLGVQGQKYLELMRGSNDDMDKHHASAMALVQKSAARALQAGSFDMMLGSTNALMSQLANNKVIGREDLSAFQQQLDGLNALPQDQKEASLRGLLRNISGVPEEEYTLNKGGARYRGDTLINENPELPEPPKSYQVTVPGPDGKPMSRLATPEEMASGVRVYQEPKVPAAGPRPTYVTLSSPTTGEQRQMETGPEANTLLGQGWKILQAGQARAVPQDLRATRAASALNAIEKLKSLAPKRAPGLPGMIEGVGEVAKGLAGYNTETRQFTSLLQPTGMQMAIALQGAANLSDSEREVMVSALGSIAGMDYESQMALLENASDMISGGGDVVLTQIKNPKTGLLANHWVPAKSQMPGVLPMGNPFNGSGKITVTAPDGTVHSFDTQAQADTFKKLVSGK